MKSKVLVYSYASCSTCRKALKWLRENNIEYDIEDIVKHPPDKKILRYAMDQVDERKKLFNTNGLSYRQIGAAVVKSMNDEEALEALSLDGKLIKRPFLVKDEQEILLGFNIKVWTDNLLI